ncbi:MAG: stage III sporulation protein AG [Kyrpidia tusciae]|nr:stage III sporulation protein AG [Kyrpidia tusciae]MBE3551619.1 stage III sporulation protein AG [Kyrpidia tusciae]
MNWNFANGSKWLWILGILGVVLIALGALTRGPSGAPAKTPSIPATDQAGGGSEEMKAYEQAYEQQLTSLLSRLPGVQDVRVMVNVDSTEEVVYARNDQNQNQTINETDKQGGTRVTASQSSNDQVVLAGQNQPLIVKRLRPQVRGVLVVAKGAQDARVQAEIVQAVAAVLGVPPHRIAVVPGQ